MASNILFAFLMMVSCIHIHAVWNVFFCREHGQTCTKNEDCCLDRICTTVSKPRVCLPYIYGPHEECPKEAWLQNDIRRPLGDDKRIMGKPGRKIKTYEVQTLERGQKSEYAFAECKKRMGHTDYIKVNEISQRLVINDSDLSEFICILCTLTALIQVPVGEKIRYGTGFVQKVERFTDKPCPCPQCKGHGEQQWGKVTLTTALHVLEDEADGTRCQVRLFYDSDDSANPITIIHGLKSHSRDNKGDWCALVCVTHDLDLLSLLEETLKRYWELGVALKEKYVNSKTNTVVVVSHPHGGIKRVSVGKGKVKHFEWEVREEQDWCSYSYDAVTCAGSSGAPVYVLGRWTDGFGYWFGHSHNHSGVDSDQCNSSTVGVDSTYGQLAQRFSYIDLEKDAIPSDTTSSPPVINIIQRKNDTETNRSMTYSNNVYNENNNIFTNRDANDNFLQV